MSVSRLLPSGGANDFNLNLTGATTTATLTKEFAAGSYSITSGSNDITMDIYAYNSDGSLAGYTNTKAFTATKGFNKFVVIGGTTSDVLGFSYKTTFTTTVATSEVTAGPVIYSISSSTMPNINDSITITGANFATDVTVSITGTGYSATAPKSTVRTNSTTLVITRPDNFPPSGSPYTITVTNPGVTPPTGSNVHILSNGLTAGGAPVWSTAASLPLYSKNVAYSQSIVATDAGDTGTTLTYSVLTNSLPTGLSYNTTTSVISGTPTVTDNGSIAIRVTDAGGNYVDRTFTVNNIGASAPVWVTAAGALTSATSGSVYSTTITATDDSGTTPTLSITSGSLPAGLSLNTSTGVITGTPTTGSNGTASSFTVAATDGNGTATSRTFSIYVLATYTLRYTASSSWTAPVNITGATAVLVAGGGGGGSYGGSNVGAGGGGAGGVAQYTSLSFTGGTTYSFTVGGGQTGTPNSTNGSGYNGGSTTFTGLTTVTGGGNGGGQALGGNGGSGGGTSGGQTPGTGISGQGFAGGNGLDQDAGGGGGGKSTVGDGAAASTTANSGKGGDGATYFGYAVGGGGAGGHSNRGGSQGSIPTSQAAWGGATPTYSGYGNNGQAFTGGGGGGSGQSSGGGTGGSGCVILNFVG
jgi:hypothetical protein